MDGSMPWGLWDPDLGQQGPEKLSRQGIFPFRLKGGFRV